MSITPAEMNVAELVAKGMTSAQIAERLFVSPRTVDSHLQQIYAKLGLSSRTELAREMFGRRARGGHNDKGRRRNDELDEPRQA